MEGPSVHAAADELRVIEGERIDSVGGNADQPLDDLHGRTIDMVRAVKKRLFLDCGDTHAVTHFLMYGTYRLDEERDRDERLRIVTGSHELNIYNGAVKVLTDGDELLQEYDRPEEDVLLPVFDREQALKALQQRNSVVASVLLDQDVFGGVGNIVKNEVLWEEGIDPRSPAAAIPGHRVDQLVDAAVRWTREWYAAKRSHLEKPFEVYQKGECADCGGDLERAVSTCLTAKPWPAATRPRPRPAAAGRSPTGP
ncbi:MAG: hypothetical protein SVW77_01145 [Candidatus Nanohaloarchaea archaeon]|nr:hypothetical protein [Candidatus Nanohaloarchaea archaeon]